MLIFCIIKEIISESFKFIRSDQGIKQLVYEPLLKDILKEDDIVMCLHDLLIKTGFSFKVGINEIELKTILEGLPFHEKIVFDYEKGNIMVKRYNFDEKDGK